MNAGLALVRYLCREVLSRWGAHPASPLARWGLTFVLSSAIGIFLIGFKAAESARRAEWLRWGLETIVVRSPAQAPLPETLPIPAGHWAAPLAGRGEFLLLQQLPGNAAGPWDEPEPVFAAPAQKLAELLEADPQARAPLPEAVWFSRDFPPGRPVRIGWSGRFLAARTAQPSGMWQALGLDSFVVVAPWGAADADARGRIDVALFRPGPTLSTQSAVRLIRDRFGADSEPPPAIRDPSPFRRALADLERAQRQWGRAMAAGLGLSVLLVFASIGILEERQTRYTQALLRSLGVRRSTLLLASAAENFLLANTALLAAFATSAALASRVLTFSGVTPSTSDRWPLAAVIALAAAVNTGVAASLVPLARAVRRPVGAVLP